MRSLSTSLALVALLAARAVAVGPTPATGQHRHDSSSHGGTRLDPVTLNVSGVATFSYDVQTTSNVPVLHKSSSTNNWTGASACPVSALGPCISGSTITVNCDGNRVEVYGNGTASSGGTGQMVIAVLQNGQFMDGQTSTKGLFAGNVSGATAALSVYFSHKSTGTVASGNVSYCMTCRSNSSTINYPGSDGAYTSVPEFGVRCLK